MGSEVINNLEALFKIQERLPRQGPGDDASTLEAYRMLNHPCRPVNILDIGCGSGMHTRILAREILGTITAMDIHQPFLDQLMQSAREEDLMHKIRVYQGMMESICFPGGSFDILWSEGSIYIMGFEEGLRNWKCLLKAGGYLVCSHLSWLRPDPPSNVVAYWNRHYPDIQGIDHNINLALDLGYLLVSQFTLPGCAWWNYFHPLSKRLDELEKDKSLDPTLEAMIQLSREEIDMYRENGAYYGYVFYLLQNPAEV